MPKSKSRKKPDVRQWPANLPDQSGAGGPPILAFRAQRDRSVFRGANTSDSAPRARATPLNRLAPGAWRFMR